MKRLIDTHAHIFLPEFDLDRETVIEKAREVTEAIILPNVDVRTLEATIKLAELHKGFCYAALGLHPCSAKENWKSELKIIEKTLQEVKSLVYAIGECGLDLYWDKTTLPYQKEALAAQIAWAKDLNKPIILHTRDAFSETFAQIKTAQDGRLRGVFHCFSETPEDAQKVADLGMFVGIGGVLTYPKSGLFERIKSYPREIVVLETDAPYLAPVPKRGKRNEPEYITYVARELARAWECDYDKVAEITNGNARKLYDLN